MCVFCIRLQYFYIHTIYLMLYMCLSRHMHTTKQIAKHTFFLVSLNLYMDLFPFISFFFFVYVLDGVHQLVFQWHIWIKKKFSVSVGYKKQQIFMLNMIMLLVQFIWKECILVPSQAKSLSLTSETYSCTLLELKVIFIFLINRIILSYLNFSPFNVRRTRER